MELKEYQSAALDTFARWLAALRYERAESIDTINLLQSKGRRITDDVRDYPKAAWETLRETGVVADPNAPYVTRSDGANNPIPHICFKVPTGGGKTLLAATALERLNRQTGLTLWVIPTRAIYEQTKAALYNREHPYRQALERASGGRVKMLQKDDPFTAADIANYLCVMLLMLPAANRQKGKDFLRMFRDSGRYPTLFPDADDALADGKMLQYHPDLERESPNGPVKHSLFNAIKTLRPVIILDEAHKAYGAKRRDLRQEFAQSVSRLNPSMVIELSATPNKGVSNLLVDIDGIALKNEEVIKLPVQIASFPNTDWKHTLLQAHDKLKELADEAKSLEHDENRYIRPIAVVRVERTGKDQRDGERIHAEDVREYLTQTLAVPDAAVAVKSSELDELRGENLLSPFTPIRWIITKSALMEGWDCPFAYLLVMLDNTSAQRAITQLVGRVMRQPDVRRTAREPLDQCYVYCSNIEVGKAVAQVKNGLEQEGLTGLGDMVVTASSDLPRVTVHRREQFRGKDIFLPLVLHKTADPNAADQWTELDYQRHILPAIDWQAINAPDPQATQPNSTIAQFASVDVGDTLPPRYTERELYIDKTPRVEWFARRLSDLIPNPWQAARIVQDLIQKCRAAGETDADIYDRRSHLAHALREHVAARLDAQAEDAFKAKLAKSEISFSLETGKPAYKMVKKYYIPAPSDAVEMTRADLQPLQLALFQPVLPAHFDSDLELRFAQYLDKQKALRWWHRVAARQGDNYYLRGWKPDRIWPDFIAMGGETDGKPHVLVFETKGAHLSGNPDTEYKKRVLKTLQDAYRESAGEMKICDGPARGTFRLIFTDEEFSTALSSLNAAPAYNA